MSDASTDPITDPASPAAMTPPPLPAGGAPEPARHSGMLCPYCGHVSANKKECDRCRGLFEPLSRQASQNGMGPWFLRDEANPFRPGCSYATIRMLVARKRIVPESILRGPSTRQFWTFARNTPGIAHLLGECHACHKSALAESAHCPHCNASFVVEDDRQYLGLAEMRLIPGQNLPEPPRSTRPSSRPTHAAHAAAAPQSAAAPATFDFAADAIPIAPEGDRVSEPPPPAFEPIRNPARPLKVHNDISESRIDELLRQSGAAERARRSTTVVVVLVAVALAAVACIIITAVIIISNAAKNPPVVVVTPPPPPPSQPASVYPPLKTGNTPGQ